MKHIKSYKLFENLETDTIKDYFSDLIDEGFELAQIKKEFIKRTGNTGPIPTAYKATSHPFQGCTDIEYTVKLTMKSDTYTNYQEEYLSTIQRCAEAEGLELVNFATQHKLVSIPEKKYHYYLEVQFREQFTEEVDINTQNLQDFEKQLDLNLKWYTRNTSFGRQDFNIERKEDRFVITTLSGINTPNKFRTVCRWFTEGSKGIDSQSIMFRKISGTFFKFDVDIQRPRFEGRRVVSPGVITITNLR